MNVIPLLNANASVISVTGTASYILPLIDTAGSVSHAFPKAVDALDITPENGDIRIMIDPSTAGLAPTASKGFLIKQGATLMLRHTDVRTIKVISTTGTVSCSLQIGLSEEQETTVISGGGGAITSIIPGTGATNLGKAEDSAHTSGDVGVMALAVRQDTPATTEADGDYTSIKVEGSKGLRVTQGSLISGENQTRNVMIVREDGDRTQITTATTTVCRNTSGCVQRIIVNGAALTGDVTIYDNASSASGSTLVIKAGMLIGSHKIGWRVSNGATVVTAAADNIVIMTGE